MAHDHNEHKEHHEEKHDDEPHDSHGKKISPGLVIFVVALVIIIAFLILSGKLKF